MTAPRLIARELTLIALTLATVVGCRRLLDGWTWFEPLLVVSVVGHVTSAAMRRLRWPLPVAALASLPMLVITIGLAFHRSSTVVGLPTGDTIDAVRADLDVAWSTFGSIRAPAEPLDGYVISAAVGFWLIAFLSDWAALRLRSPLEAVLPSTVMFGFGAVMSRGPFRETAIAVWLPAVLVFFVAAQIDRRDATGSWLAGTARRGRAVLVRDGVVAVAAISGFGLLIGPMLPGARSEALVDIAHLGEGGDGTRVTISPLVQIQSRLVDLADTEVFTVRSAQRDYWRIISLDAFDGATWGLRADFEEVGGTLPSNVPVGTVTDVVTQQFAIQALDSVWMPAAYEPRRIVDTSGAQLDYHAGLSTFVVPRGTATGGLAYTVESAVPRRDPDLLRAAAPADPLVFATELALPAAFSPALAAEARRIVGSETQPYAQSLLLQSYFREGFEYDLDVAKGQGIGRMEDFVFDVRSGYCEQFAGTFAAFARVVGLPSRVAVGFTPGDYDAASDVYRVRGVHAHAWPEVWIAGAGWVRFEPTPNRGAPGDEGYTGVREQQATPTLAPVPTTTTTALDGDSTATTVRPVEVVPDAGAGAATADSDSGSATPWPRRLAVAVAVTLGTVVALAAFTWWRHNSRRRRATQPAERIEVAWIEFCEAAALVDLAPDDAETPIEYSTRIERRLGSTAPHLRRLAAHATRARYSHRRPSDEIVADACTLSDTLVHTLVDRASRRSRARSLIVPARSRPPRHRPGID